MQISKVLDCYKRILLRNVSLGATKEHNKAIYVHGMNFALFLVQFNLKEIGFIPIQRCRTRATMNTCDMVGYTFSETYGEF